MAELLVTERRDHGVAVVRLANPPLNALHTSLLGEVGTTFATLRDDSSVKAVVVAGGERAFAAGADVSEFGGRDQARIVARAFRIAFDAVTSFPGPVIAAIRGYALGGGLELAMCCDLRVAGDSARLGQPEILLGIIPGAGGTQRLPRLVGPSRAKELIWSGRQVRSDEALTIGLVDKVVADSEVEGAAIEWASEFAQGASAAIALAKSAIDVGGGVSLAKGLDNEVDRFVQVFDTEDARIGVQSFLEHGPGKAEFTGR